MVFGVLVPPKYKKLLKIKSNIKMENKCEEREVINMLQKKWLINMGWGIVKWECWSHLDSKTQTLKKEKIFV